MNTLPPALEWARPERPLPNLQFHTDRDIARAS
jgi:hypothetical protein